jgi:hypothetical protein
LIGKKKQNNILKSTDPYINDVTAREWVQVLQQENPLRRSELCKAQDWQADWFKRWCNEMRDTPRYHRKQWEFVYVMQALWERGCIAEGKKGLVFAVGSEPGPSIFANYGCEILATDILPEEGVEKGWSKADQLCFGLDSLNKRGLTDEATLRKYVRYRPVDMNRIPAGLTGFDFNWSSCSFEHLGSIEKGLAFLEKQFDTLKPGGWAVHTTEFNISSNDKTLETGDTVIFRMRDIDNFVKRMRKKGHFVEELDYSLGGMPEDFNIDTEPHRQEVHLKLQIGPYVVTSIGLIMQKKKKSLF